MSSGRWLVSSPPGDLRDAVWQHSDGYDRSMTRLEYDEAQRLELPSLIYMIDGENQPILPKHVETGPGAEKLRALREQLKKRHVVSFFTTPEDLRARLLHDVPALLKEVGAELSGDLALPEAPSDAEVLQQREKLPKLFAGEQVTVAFMNNGAFRSTLAEECTALGLEIGASVVTRATLSTGDHFSIVGARDVALALCKLPKKVSARVRAVTAVGVYKRVDWTDDGPLLTPEVETGLIIKEIMRIEPEEGPAEPGSRAASYPSVGADRLQRPLLRRARFRRRLTASVRRFFVKFYKW